MQTDALIQHAMKGLSSLHEEKIPAEQEATHLHRTLADLLHDGFYLLLLLKNSYVPADSVNFPVQIRRLLDEFECSAKRINAVPEDIHATKYAFCAAVDELILSSEMPIRETWERAPLQLVLFGDQLAGENFFRRWSESGTVAAPACKRWKCSIPASSSVSRASMHSKARKN